MVTGAGGFIGAAMVRAFAASGARKIVLLDICEQHLFEALAEMSAGDYRDACTAVLGSACDRPLLDALFEEHRPQIVVHAGALKHVPLMESNPFAAVQTNALGTWTVARAAEKYGVRQMVLVSTDKAVAPASIMGAAKRIAELVMLAPPKAARAAVRLVNVIGSPGSVGAIFAEQIARGGPVTVTHPEAQRFFLTLREVVGLLGEAIDAQATGLLVPEPGEPMLIADLARRILGASGHNAPIIFTKLRSGEKLDESVVSSRERVEAKVTPSLHEVTSPMHAALDAHLHALEGAVASRDLPLLLRLVGDLVPDYRPSDLLRDAVSASSTQPACLPL